MFYRVALHCTCCDKVIAQTNVSGGIPKRTLRAVALSHGAVRDGAGRWYCNNLCRTDFRLKHDTSHKETPTP